MSESAKVLAQLAGLATASHDQETMLSAVLDVLHQALAEIRVTVYLPDDDRKHLVAQQVGGPTVSFGEGEVGRAWQAGSLQRAAVGEGLAVPLRAGDDVLGVMAIQPARDAALDDGLLALIQAVAGQVTLALENARLRQENSSLSAENERLFRDGLQLVGELSTLNEVIQSLNTELDLDKLLAVIHHQTSRIIDTTNFYIALLDRDRQQVSFPFCVDGGQRVEVPARPLGQGRTEWIIHAGEPLLGPSDTRPTFTEKELPLSPGVPRSYLGVPLVVGEWVFGVIAVQSYETENAFTAEDLRLLVTVAAQAGVAISNARLFEETQAALNKLHEAYKIQETLAATVRELSAPVIQIWEDALALPLVGAVDAARAQRITDSLLEGINRYRAKAVIIDVTGVPVVDAETAQHLLQAIHAARLLGAHCILTGIGADVARAIVSTGIELAGVITLVNLQAGMRYVMSGAWREVGRPPRTARTTAI